MQTVHIGQSLKARNNALAQENRALFAAKGIHVVNVLSSPGAGKTALLERTLTELRGRLRGAVIVGDLATDNDARRLARSGAPAVQITTGNTCHLEAGMIAQALGTAADRHLRPTAIDLDHLDLLFIENVGNLVCPATWDLGESARVVLFSIPEGEDKPLKYPTVFKTADLVLLTKIDLLPATEFDLALARHNVRQIAPRAEILEVSTRSGLGLAPWYDWLQVRPNPAAQRSEPRG